MLYNYYLFRSVRFSLFPQGCWSVTIGLRRPFPHACSLGHADALAVNAALVTSQ